MDIYELLQIPNDDSLCELGDLPAITKTLLLARGVNTRGDALAFLNPSYNEGTHDPFLMKDMELAVKRIMLSVNGDERIVVFSDYDTDGIPGAVVLHDFFKKIGYENFTNYIPHRNHEGFGLNKDAIAKLKDDGVGLIITVDCGTANISEVEFANSLGMDVIITDHHEPNGSLPLAFAILNPKQKDCSYPFKELCGAGVAYKLVQALIMKGQQTSWFALRGFSEGWEKWLLDMVGIATISDMVPLVGENRIFAHFGLVVLRKSPRPGLAQLLKLSGVNQRNLTEEDVGFSIGPRINAASRMDKPEDAFMLLATRDTAEASKYAEYLNHINNERKGVVASMVKEAKKKLESRDDIGSVIVLGNTHWKPSLLGLVANSLSETYKKPSFVWGREGTTDIKGSCRSDGIVNLVHLMSAVTSNFFLEFGGHEFSGGFSVSHEKIHELEERLNLAYEKVKNEEIQKLIQIDQALSLEDITWNFFDELKKLSPFGVGNDKPLFLLKEVKPVSVSTFGKQNNHLKIIFEQSSGNKISAIAFFKTLDSFKQPIDEGKSLNLIAHIEKSTFGYKPELRLRIVDVV